MTTKEQVEQCIKSLEWLKFNIVGTEEPKKNTFEYATKVYLENAIYILDDLRKERDITYIDMTLDKAIEICKALKEEPIVKKYLRASTMVSEAVVKAIADEHLSLAEVQKRFGIEQTESENEEFK